MRKSVTISLMLMALVMVSSLGFAKGGDADSNGPFTSAAPATAAFAKVAPADIAGKWAPLTPVPKGMAYNTAAYYNGAIYTFCGITAGNAPFSEVYKYDIASDTWTEVLKLQTPRMLAMAHTIGDKIYIVGGYSTANPFTTHGEVLEFDPATNTVTEKAKMLSPVYAGASFVYDGKIWVLGGGTTSFQVATSVVQIYDPATDTWGVSNSMLPQTLRSFSAQVVGDDVYFVGGYNVSGGRGIYYADVYKGAITGNEIAWTKLKDFPDGGIMRQSMGTDGSKIYLTGGYTQQIQTQGTVTTKTYSYDPATDTWTGETPKITGVLYASQMLPDGNGKFYVVGGQTAQQYSNAFEVFDANAAASPIAVLAQDEVNLWVKKTTKYQIAAGLGNVGGAPLQWSAEVDAAATWLTLDGATSGIVETASQSAISMEIDPSALAEGEHTGVVTFTTNDPDNATLTFTVTINVQEADVDTDIFVLAEQYTGTWCGYCPYGADSLKAVAGRVGDRMVRMAWHQGDPMEIPAYETYDAYMNVTGYPTASINRIKWPGESNIPISRGDWGNRVRFLLENARSPITLSIVDKDYNESTKEYTFTAKAFMHQSMEGDIRFNAVVTESGFDYEQTIYTSQGTQKLNPYIHSDVVMGIYPDVFGQKIGGGNLTTQNEYTYTFSFTSPHVDHTQANIIIFVHEIYRDGPGPVYQSYSESLMEGIVLDVEDAPTPGQFALRQNYPNPFNPTTTISFDVPERSHVMLTLHDNLGRNLGSIVDGTYEAGTHNVVFNGAELNSGTYFITMTAGDVVKTRSMTLVK